MEVIIISDSDHDSQPPSPVKKLKQELCGVDNTLTGLKCLNGTRIRSCYGCRNPIRKDLSYIPSPPHDIVISYKERRYYRDPTTQEMRLTQNDENTYYHKCVHQKHSSFQGSMLNVPEAILPFLQQIHHMHIKKQFGINI